MIFYAYGAVPVRNGRSRMAAFGQVTRCTRVQRESRASLALQASLGRLLLGEIGGGTLRK